MVASQECSRTLKTARVQKIIPESDLTFSPSLSSEIKDKKQWGAGLPQLAGPVSDARCVPLQ